MRGAKRKFIPASSSFIAYPMRKLIKKEWPENNKDIIQVLLIYGAIVVLLSVPLVNYVIWS